MKEIEEKVVLERENTRLVASLTNNSFLDEICDSWGWVGGGHCGGCTNIIIAVIKVVSLNLGGQTHLKSSHSLF